MRSAEQGLDERRDRTVPQRDLGSKEVANDGCVHGALAPVIATEVAHDSQPTVSELYESEPLPPLKLRPGAPNPD